MNSVIPFTLLLIMSTGSIHGQHHHHSNKANEYMHQHSMEELTKRFEDPSRDTWQKPDRVIELLGDIKGKTIVDIGAGTGYFAFRLAEKGATVIAADVDDNFQEFIAAKKKELNYSDQQIQLKKIPYDSPDLMPSSVDAVIIVNTYHHIENRVPYFTEVLNGLVEGGVLLVVDFKKQSFEGEAPGPPPEMRLSQKEVIKELKKSGFGKFSVNEDLLDYQYTIEAFRTN